MSTTQNRAGAAEHTARRWREGRDGADPFAGVLALGRMPFAVMVFAAILAVSMHAVAAVGVVQTAVLAVFASWARDASSAVADRLVRTYEIEVVRLVESEKERPEDPPPRAREATAKPTVPVKAPPKNVRVPPPAAAEAPKVLTQAPKPEPTNSPDTSYLSGDADRALGGTTQIGGTATAPTNDPAATATGVPGGTGTAAKPDRSREARLLAPANLERCPFPSEADADDIDEAVVGIKVKVSVEGRAEAADVVSDPGHGFGREARKCVLREQYDPARNADGAPVPGTSRVRFTFRR